MTNESARSIGLSLLLLGLAVGGIGRSLHLAESASIAMSIASGLFSVAAMVFFYRSMAAGRKRTFVFTIAATLLVLLAIVMAVLLRH